ncbi:hypothetical protein VNI00_001723 [Paramarasmius palmivorus]|uniref:BZIP domain-containing protein n=1 Tax=Paramarasmius palmivorus TaxID=297713 RepID=A0AAW0E156_9AGAR
MAPPHLRLYARGYLHPTPLAHLSIPPEEVWAQKRALAQDLPPSPTSSPPSSPSLLSVLEHDRNNGEDFPVITSSKQDQDEGDHSQQPNNPPRQNPQVQLRPVLFGRHPQHFGHPSSNIAQTGTHKPLDTTRGVTPRSSHDSVVQSRASRSATLASLPCSTTHQLNLPEENYHKEVNNSNNQTIAVRNFYGHPNVDDLRKPKPHLRHVTSRGHVSPDPSLSKMPINSAAPQRSRCDDESQSSSSVDRLSVVDKRRQANREQKARTRRADPDLARAKQRHHAATWRARNRDLLCLKAREYRRRKAAERKA